MSADVGGPLLRNECAKGFEPENEGVSRRAVCASKRGVRGFNGPKTAQFGRVEST
jgi:hypothetical protein